MTPEHSFHMLRAHWTPQPGLAPLWAAVAAARPDARSLIDRVILQLDAFDPDFAAEMASVGEIHLRDAYLIRFVLPLAELAGKHISAKFLHEAMTAQFLWCYHWRTLDNVLDSSERDGNSVRQLTTSAVRAAEFHTLISARYDLPSALSKTSLVAMACDASCLERSGGIKTDEIWSRAAPFFIVPYLLLSCNEHQIEAYRSYINLLGLCHDIGDIFSDVEAKIWSVPVSWLRRGQDYKEFDRSVAENFFLQAQKEVDRTSILARQHLKDIDGSVMLSIISFVTDSLGLG